jgi:hypothetical protein
MGCRLISFFVDGGEGRAGEAEGEASFRDWILISCPEGSLIEIFFPGTKAPALALSDIGRVGFMIGCTIGLEVGSSLVKTVESLGIRGMGMRGTGM